LGKIAVEKRKFNEKRGGLNRTQLFNHKQRTGSCVIWQTFLKETVRDERREERRRGGRKSKQ